MEPSCKCFLWTWFVIINIIYLFLHASRWNLTSMLKPSGLPLMSSKQSLCIKFTPKESLEKKYFEMAIVLSLKQTYWKISLLVIRPFSCHILQIRLISEIILNHYHGRWSHHNCYSGKGLLKMHCNCFLKIPHYDYYTAF